MEYYITKFIITLLITIHFYQYILHNDQSITYYLYNMKNLFLQKLFSPFFHFDGFHLFQNCITFYNLRFIETIISQKEYIKMILFLIILNSIIWNILSEIFFIRLSIGFSGVLFGLLTIFPTDSFFGFPINKYFYPFLILSLMQIIVPNVSFMGHFIGIISGYLYIYYHN